MTRLKPVFDTFAQAGKRRGFWGEEISGVIAASGASTQDEIRRVQRGYLAGRIEYIADALREHVAEQDFDKALAMLNQIELLYLPKPSAED